MNLSDVRCKLGFQVNKFEKRVLLASKCKCTERQVSIYKEIVEIGKFLMTNFEQFDSEEIVSFLALCDMADAVHDNLNSDEVRTRAMDLLTVLIEDKKTVLVDLYGYNKNEDKVNDNLFVGNMKKSIMELEDELYYVSLLFAFNKNRLRATGHISVSEPLYLQASEFAKEVLSELSSILNENIKTSLGMINTRITNLKSSIRAMEVVLTTENQKLYDEAVIKLQNIKDDIDKPYGIEREKNI